ncbi:MAG: hypothetical protein ABGZ49_06315 [Akkermansiaceae bacterium]
MKIYCHPNPNPVFAFADTDWFGEQIDPAVFYRFSLEPSALSFIAKREQAALCHPGALAGHMQAELWKYDVAEFFLTDPVTGHYLEVNLSPNGSHWCCEFSAPRQVVREIDDSGITSGGELGPGNWQAHASLPLSWLEDQFHFGPESRLNATFILDSPHQRFVTASYLGTGEPDFHRPQALPRISIISDP